MIIKHLNSLEQFQFALGSLARGVGMLVEAFQCKLFLDLSNTNNCSALVVGRLSIIIKKKRFSQKRGGGKRGLS